MNIGEFKSIISSRVNASNTPIQQIKAGSQTSRGLNTQGRPQPVSNVSISVTKALGDRILRISFIQNPNDPYFVSADIYIVQGNTSPRFVASGISPVSITLHASNIPAIVTVVSSGNWGTTSLASSPGKVVSLA